MVGSLEVIYLLAFVQLVVKGGGASSLDHVIVRLCPRCSSRVRRRRPPRRERSIDRRNDAPRRPDLQQLSKANFHEPLEAPPSPPPHRRPRRRAGGLSHASPVTSSDDTAAQRWVTIKDKAADKDKPADKDKSSCSATPRIRRQGAPTKARRQGADKSKDKSACGGKDGCGGAK